MLLVLFLAGDASADLIDNPDLLMDSRQQLTLPKAEDQIQEKKKENVEVNVNSSENTENRGELKTQDSKHLDQEEVGIILPATKKKKVVEKNGFREPIRLKSDGKSIYSRDGGMIHLAENVELTQANLRLQADQAKVFLDQEDSGNSVSKVEIFGNVHISKNDDDPKERMTARGEKAYFFNEQRQVTLVGNVRLWRGGQLIKGKKITYHLETGMVIVDQASGVVNPELRQEDRGK